MQQNDEMPQLHPNCQRVQNALLSAGVSAQVISLPDSTHSAKEAAQALGTSVAQIAKSLIFLADGMPIVVIASGINRVSLEKLGKFAGAAITQPDGKSVKDLVGFPIGGVPPLGFEKKLRIFVDKDLAQYDRIWAAAGTPNSVFSCTPMELIASTGGELCDLRQD